MNKIDKNKDGYALLELLFYISIFVILALVVINAIIVMARSFKETAIQTELVQSANIIERISREIRTANSINSISASSLKLNTKDSFGVDKTIQFSLASSDLEFRDNDILTGNLNASNISVTSLVFTEITTILGKAIKVTLTVSPNNDVLSRTYDFYDTIVLRGGY